MPSLLGAFARSCSEFWVPTALWKASKGFTTTWSQRGSGGISATTSLGGHQSDACGDTQVAAVEPTRRAG